MAQSSLAVRVPFGVLLAGWLLAVPTVADTVTLAPTKDNTLYEDATGSLSNGSGQHLFAGRTSVTTDAIRRALIAFDVAGSIPAGSTIDGVTLTLHMSKAPFGVTQDSYELRRVLSDWGEGASDAQFQEGGGAPAAAGDATWRHTFFDTQVWDTDGGDFSGISSGTAQIGGVVGFYSWGPTAAMQADVQSWLDDPAGSFGWILIGPERSLQTARRFDSLQNTDPSFRPALTIEFTPPTAGGAGRVPDGNSVPGEPLRIAPADAGDILLTWSSGCNAADDYEVYEGVIGDFTSHVPVTCTTGGLTTASVSPIEGNAYYLIVPRSEQVEGSYGTDSADIDRPPSTAACLAQTVAQCP